MDSKQQELMFKLAMFEQKIQALQQQLRAIDGSLNDLGILYQELDDLKGATGKEMLAPMGRGIFVKAKITSENLIVDVGGKNFVGKSIDETKTIILEQSEKLNLAKEDLIKKLEDSEKELTEIISKEEQEDSED